MIVGEKGGKQPEIPLNSPLTAFGDLRTTELHPLVAGSFEYTIGNAELNTNAVVGTGEITQANGMANVSTGATAGGTAMLHCATPLKYRAGLGGLSRFTALFTTPVAATEQLIGIVDEAGSSVAFKNGLMIGYIGTTFGIHRFQNDTITTIAQSAWDDKLDGTGPSGMTVDFTKLNVFAINYQYLGAGNIFLMVENPATGKFIQFHNLKYANLNTNPSTFNPNYHFTIWANNKAVNSALVIKCASYGYFVEGHTEHTEIHQPQFSSGFRSKTTVTTEVALFTLQNKATYPTGAPKTNFVSVFLERLVASIEANAANNLAEIRIVKNATLGGTPSYADISATNSVCSIDVAGTTVTGGKTLLGIPLAGKNDKAIDNLTDYTIYLSPGDKLTVAGLSVNSATISASLLWKELF